VLAATLSPSTDQIARVGGPQILGLGGLGGDLGGLGIANEDVHMFGGGTCNSEPRLTATGVRGPSQGFGVLLCPLVAICP
jgi:hypothetical protein